jgi:molybdopterin-containing oxidoreductase family iron-sulfur binding subunit
MAGLNRRDFLKALGLSSVTAAGACNHGLDTNLYRTPIEDVLPYVVKPEQLTPGTPTFFATTVTSGPDAYPVLARHRDGRVINVDNNPRSSMPTGIPKASLLELQRLYSPDRYKAPQKGEETLAWVDALSTLSEAVTTAKQAGKKVAYLGPYRSGPIAQLIRDYTDNNAIFWEPTGHAAEATAWEALFGERQLPNYDLTQAEYVLSFGAAFLGWWGGPQMESQYAAARDPNSGHFVTQFALVSPHVDQVGANSDDWYPCRAGSQAHLAFAIAKLIAAKKGYSGNATAILDGISPTAAAQQAGLNEAELDAIATHFAEAKAAIALPGPANDTDLVLATYLINIVSGNTGSTFKNGGYTGSIHGYPDVEKLIKEMAEGQVGVLLIDDSNPVYALPTDAGFTAALDKVDFVAGLSSHPDETNEKAHVIFPTSSPFEDWGYEESRSGIAVLRQPAMTALWDTRSLGDILLMTAKQANIAPAIVSEDASAEPIPSPFAAADWKTYVENAWLTRNTLSSFTDNLHDGVHASSIHLGMPSMLPSTYRFTPRTLSDGIDVVLYVHPHRYDGRYANQPWAQEISDPMTGHVWDSWVEVGPDLFDGKLDLSAEVAIKSTGGEVKAGAVRYRGLHKNTVAIALGQGHTANGRYANGTGVNGFALTQVVKDSFGNLILDGITATMTATGETSDLVTTFGQDNVDNPGALYQGAKGGDGKRDWGVSVNADQLAEAGDTPQDDPHQVGWLTGIHHLARDSRLIEANELDFYGEPDHPNYRFGMSIDTNACNGCGACVIACYAENNLAVVGKPLIAKGREMNWLRINRYWEETPPAKEGDRPQFDVQFVPMMCQQCGHAPCESVCPVLATYHNIDGLNAMIYNRCVGTRYCANNCPYVVRRFNFHSYKWPEPFNLQLNPEVSVRTMGVMEKCTFCIQRTRNVKIAYRNEQHMSTVDGVVKSTESFTAKVPDSALQTLPACSNSCPAGAITFGDKNSKASKVSQLARSPRSYEILAELNVKSAVNYLAKANHHMKAVEHHGGHGDSHGGGHGDSHGGGHGDSHGGDHKSDHDGSHGSAHGDEHKEPSKTHHEGGH